MKFLVSILLVCIAAFAISLYFPWWSIAVASFAVSVMIYQPPLRSFITGFCGLFILWLIVTIKINSANDGILAHRMSTLIGLGESGFNLILITCLIGGITGGLAALTGSLLRRAFVKLA